MEVLNLEEGLEQQAISQSPGSDTVSDTQTYPTETQNFSKTLVNVFTIGRNWFLSAWVIRLVSDSGKIPRKNKKRVDLHLDFIMRITLRPYDSPFSNKKDCESFLSSKYDGFERSENIVKDHKITQ